MSRSLIVYSKHWLYCRCWHALQALEASEMAEKTEVKIADLKDLSKDERKLMEKNSVNNTIYLFTLPGGNICVPLLPGEEGESGEEISYTHVMDEKVSYH